MYRGTDPGRGFRGEHTNPGFRGIYILTSDTTENKFLCMLALLAL